MGGYRASDTFHSTPATVSNQDFDRRARSLILVGDKRLHFGEQKKKTFSLFSTPKERREKKEANEDCAGRVCALARVSDRYDGFIVQYRFGVLAEQHVSQLKHFKRSGFVYSLFSVLNIGSHCKRQCCKRVRAPIILSSECPTAITSGIWLVAFSISVRVCDFIECVFIAFHSIPTIM